MTKAGLIHRQSRISAFPADVLWSRMAFLSIEINGYANCKCFEPEWSQRLKLACKKMLKLCKNGIVG